MNACGLIVEYNPFHNGHVYHVQQAKKISQAQVIIAVMSGSFLQRGEPAIVDKFHRAKAALSSGVDIIVELPFAFSVQHSDIFARGAIRILNELGVSSICFGSESGMIEPFLNHHQQLQLHETTYQTKLKNYLNKGFSYPDAHTKSIEKLQLVNELDLSQPNNILGASYVKAILNHNYKIKPLTIKRKNNAYHDTEITNSIASATSIRNDIFKNAGKLSPQTKATLPQYMVNNLDKYYHQTKTFHHWEAYFPYLHYRVQTMFASELRNIHGVNEGIEQRILKTAKTAESMQDWLEKMKTKRYTWARLQRLFTHILINSQKETVKEIVSDDRPLPHIRLLGMTENGRNYLQQIKKDMETPLITSISQTRNNILDLDERASKAYYSILPAKLRINAFQQELQPPIIKK